MKPLFKTQQFILPFPLFAIDADESMGALLKGFLSNVFLSRPSGEDFSESLEKENLVFKIHLAVCAFLHTRLRIII
jgi:hypothetical protein